MKITEFPMCCGIQVLNDFDSDDYFDEQFGGYVNNLTVSGIKDLIRAAKEDYKCGLILATTSSSQKEASEKLKEAGFKVLLRFSNPIHNYNRITLWYKHLVRQKKKAILRPHR